MTDHLFSLEQQVQRAKEEGLSAAQAYEDDPQANRLLAIQQSLILSKETDKRSITNTRAASLSQATSYLAEEFAYGNVELPASFNERNVASFIDGLFNARVRSTLREIIRTAIQAREKESWLINKATLELILQCWLNAWKPQDDKPRNRELFDRTHPSDRLLMNFLYRYINSNKLSIFVPKLEQIGADTLVRYRLEGYDCLPLTGAGSEPAVKYFLRLLAVGAHFVVISSPADLDSEIKIPNFYSSFLENLPVTSAIYHSHYAGSPFSPGNILSAAVYPDFMSSSGDRTPDRCPFIVSLLVGRTDYYNKAHNTFFQLEGWPATSTLNELAGMVTKMVGLPTRHGRDFDVHDATKWNISTYGACPYSEKRGTTVFLAPETWNPSARMSPDTIMACYAGANPAQSWLDRTLIR